MHHLSIQDKLDLSWMGYAVFEATNPAHTLKYWLYWGQSSCAYMQWAVIGLQRNGTTWVRLCDCHWQKEMTSDYHTCSLLQLHVLKPSNWSYYRNVKVDLSFIVHKKVRRFEGAAPILLLRRPIARANQNLEAHKSKIFERNKGHYTVVK